MPMRVVCEQCGSNYTLPDERLTPGRRVQFACRHCQHRIVVEIGGVPATSAASPAPAPAPAAPAPAARPSAPVPAAALPARMPTSQQGSVPSSIGITWFVAMDDDRQERMSSQNLRQAIADGAVGAQTLVWRKGYAQWLTAGEAPEWAAAFRSAAMPGPASRPPPTPAQARDEGPGPTLASSLVQPRGQTASGPEGDPVHVSDESLPIIAVKTPDNGMQIAGVASVWRASPINTNHAAQKAVALPIIRMAPAASEQVAPGHAAPPAPAAAPASPRPQSGLVRREPAQPAPAQGLVRREPRPAPAPSQETQLNDVVHPQAPVPAPADPSSWAPATDTYTGPKGKVTHRVDEQQRQALLQSVERQEFQQRLQVLQVEVRSWQRLALGLLVAFVLVLGLAVWAAVKWTAAEADLDACRTPAATGSARAGQAAPSPGATADPR